MGRFISILIICLTLTCNLLYPQTINPGSLVNPFIGTAKSEVPTQWGGEGGTCPGSVAPFGFIQLTPETSVSEPFGYNYRDSSIYFFSCINHFSGYPNGSAGNIAIMPVDHSGNFKFKQYKRPFSHSDESAEPGYYRVEFSDNHTTVEVTSTERSGMFRFTFPEGAKPQLFVGDMGAISFKSDKLIFGSNHHTVLEFSDGIQNEVEIDGGYLLDFEASGKPKVITLKLSTSGVSFESAQNNLKTELSAQSFDQVRKRTFDQWNKELSAIEVEDASIQNKTIFYTALYHSFLLPWIISDVEGNYRGNDNKVHQAKGKCQYAGFSPWDTFRTLHPLLCLLKPERQSDMVQSMIDVYQQTGHLPIEPMTGNHAVPIIVDSYLKGILKTDSTLLYQAMEQSIVNPPFLQNDLEIYQQQGYVPATYPESVTRTIEYAYDDWALAQFSKYLPDKEAASKQLLARGLNYRNLFNVGERFLLPRNKNDFRINPGTFGYKEGDKWVYSFFVPQNPKDLVNLMGGDQEFTSLLDSALRKNIIVFDNETAFHIPYLFNYASAPQLTQKWVRNILQNRYGNTPGGIPGNDDLGSMSSWYVWSAMGLYPVCPGRPEYNVSAPIFRKVTIHLENNKQFVIESPLSGASQCYVKALKVNGESYNQLQIPHSVIANGGQMEFQLGAEPDNSWVGNRPLGETSQFNQSPDFEINNVHLSKNKVLPNELFWVRFSLVNHGALGTKVVKLYADGKECNRKNCLVNSGETLNDSISGRQFPVGFAQLSIDDLTKIQVEVLRPEKNANNQWNIDDLKFKQLVKKGETLPYSFSVRNIGGYKDSIIIQTDLNEIQAKEEKLVLNSGEKKVISSEILITQEGLQSLRINSLRKQFKAYSQNTDASVLDISTILDGVDSLLIDRSGLNNNGRIISSGNPSQGEILKLGKDCFVEIGNPMEDGSFAESITMMLWICPSGENKGLSDIFTKGDFNAIQSSGNKSLTFFAGGWGRGTCNIDLPPDWTNNWHHIAGVCDGKSLKLYLDGALKASFELKDHVDLSSSGHWVLGRNEEFPLSRIFSGYADKVKVFAAALIVQEINEIINQERNSLIQVNK